MLRNLVLKTIRDRRRGLFWWAVGIFVYAIFLGYLWPLMEESQSVMASMLEAYPRELYAIMGVADIDEMFTPAGYLVSQAFAWLVPVIFAIYAAAMGAQLIAGEEEANTLDLLLANPISRTSVALQKWAAMAITIAILGAALFLSMVAIELIFALGIPYDRYFAACLQATLLGLLFGSIAFAAGALGARRALTLGIVSALAVAAFLINSLRGLTDWLETLSAFSPFYYYDSNRPLFEGIDWLNVAVLAGVSLLGLVVALWAFPRRDVGT